jgi:signal transduction histidine kinase
MPSAPYLPHSPSPNAPTLTPTKKLNALLHHSPLAMIEWDSHLIVQGWNPAAAELFNFFEDEALGQRLDELLAQRQIVALGRESWQSCESSSSEHSGEAGSDNGGAALEARRTGALHSHMSVAGKKLCRWYKTPFMVKGQQVSTLATIVDVTHQSALSHEELRAQLQSRTQVLKHTTERLQSAISDRAQKNAALLESEARFRALTANVPGVLYQFRLSADGEPSFTFASSSCTALLEVSPAELQADVSLLISRIHPEDLALFNSSVAASAQTLTDWHWQGRIALPSGRLVWIQGASRPKKLADGSILWDGLLMDITADKAAEAALQLSETQLRAQTQQLKATLKQLKQTQTKLIQSEKMSSLGQLVAGIAHEINNPVNFIHGNLTHAQSYIQDLLKMMRLYQKHYPVPAAEIQQLTDELELDYVLNDLPALLTSVQSGTHRIRQIVLSLRNFSRLDESVLKQANIHEGLESTLMILSNRLKATASRHLIEVVKAYENIPLVECYVSQLNQSFMSILVNAIDAIDGAAAAAIAASMPHKTYQIALQTFQKGAFVVIRITNNGPPIPAKTVRRMFDPFFTTKPVGKGTGMGLAISYQTVVSLHRGALEHSQTDDQRTVFTIEIPIKTPAAPES